VCVQACNHNRIIDDIGVVQIPKKIKNRWGDTVHIDFAFGREYQSKKLSDYDVVSCLQTSRSAFSVTYIFLWYAACDVRR
jgi:hypothetical protein